MRGEWVVAGAFLACVVWAAVATAAERTNEGLDLQALARYLHQAKLEGYASGDETRIQRLPDGAQSVHAEGGGYVYRDHWYGDERFIGEEVVWHEARPVWAMSFYGATTPGRPIPAEFPKFHKSALRHAPADAPLRGPALFSEGEFVYVNTYTGALAEFSGVERVFYRGEEIFHLTYHGGTLR